MSCRRKGSQKLTLSTTTREGAGTGWESWPALMKSSACRRAPRQRAADEAVVPELEDADFHFSGAAARRHSAGPRGPPRAHQNQTLRPSAPWRCHSNASGSTQTPKAGASSRKTRGSARPAMPGGRMGPCLRARYRWGSVISGRSRRRPTYQSKMLTILPSREPVIHGQPHRNALPIPTPNMSGTLGMWSRNIAPVGRPPFPAR